MTIKRKSKIPGSWTLTIDTFIDYLTLMGNTGRLLVTDPTGRTVTYDGNSLRDAFARGKSAISHHTRVPVKVMCF